MNGNPDEIWTHRILDKDGNVLQEISFPFPKEIPMTNQTPFEPTEKNMPLINLYLQLQAVEEVAKLLSQTQPSRELSLSITNLQQSRLWLSEALANQT